MEVGTGNNEGTPNSAATGAGIREGEAAEVADAMPETAYFALICSPDEPRQ